MMFGVPSNNHKFFFQPHNSRETTQTEHKIHTERTNIIIIIYRKRKPKVFPRTTYILSIINMWVMLYSVYGLHQNEKKKNKTVGIPTSIHIIYDG